MKNHLPGRWSMVPSRGLFCWYCPSTLAYINTVFVCVVTNWTSHCQHILPMPHRISNWHVLASSTSKIHQQCSWCLFFGTLFKFDFNSTVDASNNNLADSITKVGPNHWSLLWRSPVQRISGKQFRVGDKILDCKEMVQATIMIMFG